MVRRDTGFAVSCELISRLRLNYRDCILSRETRVLYSSIMQIRISWRPIGCATAGSLRYARRKDTTVELLEARVSPSLPCRSVGVRCFSLALSILLASASRIVIRAFIIRNLRGAPIRTRGERVGRGCAPPLRKRSRFARSAEFFVHDSSRERSRRSRFCAIKRRRERRKASFTVFALSAEDARKCKNRVRDLFPFISSALTHSLSFSFSSSH